MNIEDHDVVDLKPGYDYSVYKDGKLVGNSTYTINL